MGEKITAVINHGLPDIAPPNEKEQAEWNEWEVGRPVVVRELCKKFSPWYYYYMPATKQIVTIEAYAEDGTMRVLVVGDQVSIPVIVPFSVFGIKPSDLVRLEPGDIKR